jgi:hypothetical protein
MKTMDPVRAGFAYAVTNFGEAHRFLPSRMFPGINITP